MQSTISKNFSKKSTLSGFNLIKTEKINLRCDTRLSPLPTRLSHLISQEGDTYLPPPYTSLPTPSLIQIVFTNSRILDLNQNFYQ